jgi:hypothetical protein
MFITKLLSKLLTTNGYIILRHNSYPCRYVSLFHRKGLNYSNISTELNFLCTANLVIQA